MADAEVDATVADASVDVPTSCTTSNITAGATTTAAIMTATSMTLPRPAGGASGDVMVAGFTQNTGAPLLTPPAGWIAIDSASVNFVYYKVAGAAEPVSYVWTFSAPTFASGVISSFTGTFCGMPPLDMHSSVQTSVYTASSIITSSDDELLVLVLSSGNGGQTWSLPAGFAVDYPGGQNSTSTAVFHQIQPTAGASGTKTAVPTIVDTGRAYLIGFR